MGFIIRRLSFVAFSSFLLAGMTTAQSGVFPKPRQEKLLNDLKVLIWNQPDAEKVTVKIRIHSGSAFDPEGKEGTFMLLSKILFPDESIIQLFEEELEGEIDVQSDYDFIQINATAKADEFLNVLETIAPAIINPRIDKEITEKVKSDWLEQFKELEGDPNYLAERLVARKLLGDFPYGRPREGTRESISRIDFADLLFAKQKFLTADNATIAVIGNVRADFAYRAVKRHFSRWLKKTDKVPDSFRLPDSPDLDPETVKAVGDNQAQKHYALNGFARNDPAYYAAKVAEKILDDRLRAMAARDSRFSNPSVRHSSHLLGGLFLIHFSVSPADAGSSGIETDLLRNLLGDPISQTEFDKGNSAARAEYLNRDPAELWFDTDSYRLAAVSDEIKSVNAVEIASVRKIINQLKMGPIPQATVLFEKADKSFVQDPDPTDPRK